MINAYDVPVLFRVVFCRSFWPVIAGAAKTTYLCCFTGSNCGNAGKVSGGVGFASTRFAYTSDGHRKPETTTQQLCSRSVSCFDW